MSPFPHYLILLFFLASPNFQPRRSVAGYDVPDGVCQEYCEKNRQSSHKDRPYEFSCNSTYTNEKEIEKCLAACQLCPAQVCDEYDSYSSDKFHCPPVTFTDPDGIEQPCKERCERNRPRGKRESFDMYCGSDVSDDKDECYTCDSNSCPKFVCETHNNYASKYYCPAVQFEQGVCQDRCDRSRNTGQVGPYEMYCGLQSDNSKCQRECGQCPDYVCSSRLGGYSYFCPTPHINTECQEICDKHRGSNDGVRSYTIYCNEKYDSAKCNVLCNSCPHFICDKSRGYDDIRLHCPKKEEENIWTYNPPKKESYKGRCKNRCDKNRGGGPNNFELDCKKRYETQDEVALCTHDCTVECPLNSCSNRGSNPKIQCKANQTEVDRLEKERQDELDSLEEENAKKRHKLVVALIIFGVLLAVVIGGFVAYICYSRRKNRTGPVPYAYASATTVHGQQQQVQYIPVNGQILQHKQENTQNANVYSPHPQQQPQYPIQSSSANTTSTPTFQQYPGGNVAPAMAKSTSALPTAPAPPPPPSHPPTGPSPQPQNIKAPPAKEPATNQAKPTEPPKPTVVDNKQTPPTSPTKPK